MSASARALTMSSLFSICGRRIQPAGVVGRRSTLTVQRPAIVLPQSLRSSVLVRQFSIWPWPTSATATPQTEGIDLQNEPIVPDKPTTLSNPEGAPEPNLVAPDASALEGPTLLSDIADSVTSSVPAAMQYGDLAALGLTSWTPAGLVRWGLEALHVSTGMPWFYTIVVSSVLVRLVIAPLNIISTRDTARLAPYQPQLTALAQKMREAAAVKDITGIQRARQAQQALLKAAHVKPLRMTLAGLGGIFLQIPLSFGMFFGVKTMCELPVEQLKYSGHWLIPDLTVPDPTYMLPLACAVLISLQTKLVLPDMMASGNMTLVHGMNVLRVAVFPLSFFMVGLPSGVLVSIIASVVSYCAQIAFLRVPAVRRSLDLPALDPSMRTPPTFMQTIKYINTSLTQNSSTVNPPGLNQRRRPALNQRRRLKR